MNNVGRTVRGVRMGCHAFSRCCLKAVSSDDEGQQGTRAWEESGVADALAGFLQLPFSFLDWSLEFSSFRPRFRLKRPIIVQSGGEV